MVERTVSERLTEPGHPSIIGSSVIVSPDCQRVAYAARAGEKRFVVVNGREGEQYEGIAEGSLVFSPDSQRVGYVARAYTKGLVVVDGQEQKQYDRIAEGGFFPPRGRGLRFSAPTVSRWPMRLVRGGSGLWS